MEGSVNVRVSSLSQALATLLMAGYQELEVSQVSNALKLSATKEGGELVVINVWSIIAEDTAAMVGQGERQLTQEEIEYIEQGKCPICENHQTVYKGGKIHLAMRVYCDADHIFWVPPPPLVPEYLGKHGEEPKVKPAEAAQELLQAEAEAEIGGEGESTKED